MLPFPQDLVGGGGGSPGRSAGALPCAFAGVAFAGVARLACLLAFGVKETPNLYPCIAFCYSTRNGSIGVVFSSLVYAAETNNSQ